MNAMNNDLISGEPANRDLSLSLQAFWLEWWMMPSCVLDLGRIPGAMTDYAQGVRTSIAKITDHLGISLAGDG